MQLILSDDRECIIYRRRRGRRDLKRFIFKLKKLAASTRIAFHGPMFAQAFNLLRRTNYCLQCRLINLPISRQSSALRGLADTLLNPETRRNSAKVSEKTDALPSPSAWRRLCARNPLLYPSAFLTLPSLTTWITCLPAQRNVAAYVLHTPG